MINKIKKNVVGIALAIFIIGTIGNGMKVYDIILTREYPKFFTFYVDMISSYGLATLLLAGMAIAALVTGALAMFVMKLLRV